MTPWRILREVLTGRLERWNADDDDTLRYLRAQRAVANQETRRLRREEAFPLARSTRTRVPQEGFRDAR